MLHAAELESGQDDEVLLVEGAGHAGVGLEPVECGGALSEDGVQLGDLLRVCFAVIGRQCAPLVAVSSLLETSRSEGKEVRAQRTCRCEVERLSVGVFFLFRDTRVRHTDPFGGQFERKREDGLQVGLVEAREDRPRTVGHGEGVEVVVVAVERLVARGESYADRVFARLSQCSRQDDVLVAEGVCGRLSVHSHLGDLVLRLAEVDDDLGGCIESEADAPFARDGCVFVSGDGEA